MADEILPVESGMKINYRGKTSIANDSITPTQPAVNNMKKKHQLQQHCDEDISQFSKLIPAQHHHQNQDQQHLQQQMPKLQAEQHHLTQLDMEHTHSSFQKLSKTKSGTDDGSKFCATVVTPDCTESTNIHGKTVTTDCSEYVDGGSGIGVGVRQFKGSSDMLVVHLIIGFRDICVFTLVLPLGTLLVCFISAYVFQPEEIHETHCQVYNIIPSISAITGVSPQRYLWRVSIALHIGPRFIIAFVYRNWYRAMVNSLIGPENTKQAYRMINFVYWLNLVEISALCGVTYISNKENYPLHEKVFIIFMTTSLSYMLATLKLLKILQPDGPQTPKEETSLRYKQAFFALSIASTVGLILFFLKHRFLCQELAFSWFALCEYIVASANMGFHCTTMLDFPTEDFIIAKNATQYKKPQSALGWKL